MANTTLRAAEIELFPAQDDTHNHQINDAVGNKLDTAVIAVGTTKSIMAYCKGLINQLVTAITKIDTVDTVVDGIATNVELITDHIHGVAKVYPTLAAGVTITCPASAWTLGNYTSVVPANAITSIFDIHGVKFENYNTVATYEIVFYEDSGAGADYVEIGRLRHTVSSADADKKYISYLPLMSPLVAANKRISAKVANSTAGAATITISLMYHTY